MNENIVRYIQQYRQTYTREAINEQLIRAGYNPTEIEAAWIVLETNKAPPDQPPFGSFSPPGAIPGQAPPSDPYAGQRPPGWTAPGNQAAPPPGGSYGLPGGQMYAQPPLYNQNQPPPYYVPPPRPPRLRSNPRFWAAFLGYLFGLPALVAAGSAINSDLGTIIFWLGLIGGIIGVITLHRREHAVSRGLLAGLILLIVVPIVLGFIAIVIVLGICLVAGTRV